MSRAILAVLIVVIISVAPGAADAEFNWNGSWALHYAGPHNAKANTCEFTVNDCWIELEYQAPDGSGHYDIYIIAGDVTGIAGTRYGLCSEESFFFYGWTKCSDFEIPTSGWPGIGEANAQTWSIEQPGPHVTVGILDVYVYGTSSFCVCADDRVGFAEFCDGSEPSPLCNQKTEIKYFGCMGFGESGFNPCLGDAAEQKTWGVIKSMYK
jgi:hypothetical protein